MIKGKIVGIAALITVASLTSTVRASDDCINRTFTTTAYYSPLPNQAFYIMGNEEADKYLNGQGTHGASGQPVTPGMLAAPQNYEFGGTITIPGLGKGVIRDRGGAIVNAGERGNEYDRIDIWLGKGEEGLIRALTRGKQDITSTYCPGDQQEEADFTWSNMTLYKNFFDMSIIKFNLEKGREDVFVWKLQEYLIKMGYLERQSPTGFFGDETAKAICDFQIDYGIVQGHESEWCGIYGPQTRAQFNNVLKNKGLYPQNFREIASAKDIVNQAHQINQKIGSESGEIIATVTQQKEESKSPSLEIEEKIVASTEDSIQETITIQEDRSKAYIFQKEFTVGNSGFEIVRLQELLQDFGLYSSDVDGYMNQYTLERYREMIDTYTEKKIEEMILQRRGNFLAFQ